MKKFEMNHNEMATIWGALRTTINEMNRAIEETDDDDRRWKFTVRKEECLKMMAKIEAQM